MDRTPVFVLTGFLGAGKSTLLGDILRDPDFSDTAVIINEFGDVALDHDLVRVGKTRFARTTTGCLCCTTGSDIRTTLFELHEAATGGGPPFSRVVVETTGLADPAPLANELIPGRAPPFSLRDLTVARRFELAGVVTLVDIVTGETSIENHFEAAKQIAFADRIVLTKTDLVRDPASVGTIADVSAGLAALNPAAPILDRHAAGFRPTELFQPRAYVPAALGDDVVAWLALEAAIRSDEGRPHGAATHSPSRHGGRIRTFAIVRDEPVGEDALRHFLGLVAMGAGPRLLRVKGLVHQRGEPERPRVVHAVQHLVHPPTILDAWPSEDRRTRLVFITDGIEPKPVRELFEAVLDTRPISVGRVLADLGTSLRSAFQSGMRRLARSQTG